MFVCRWKIYVTQVRRVRFAGCFLASTLVHCNLFAQTHRSVESHIRFFSSAPVEDIEAVNAAGASLFNLSTGEIAFSIPIKEFRFEKTLMQEHFNENYMESDKYPTATFQGLVKNINTLQTNPQKVWAEGEMTIHGVSKNVRIEGELILQERILQIRSVFPVKLNDYNIKIPRLLFRNIAEVVEVTVLFDYEEM
ncbi:MAG: YceI family protein [Cyclobacteriaceae bacterium]|nr:YceI family protein [Cyclobacteriaceae bacterium]